MDPISDWVASEKIPVGRWGQTFFDWLIVSFPWLFDSISNGLRAILDAMVHGLLWFPPIAIVLAMAALAFALKRSVVLSLGVVLGLLFIVNLGLWTETIYTLVLVVSAAAVSMAIAVPVGIWAAHNDRVYAWLQPVLDLMQTLPTFVYLIPVLTLFGLGVAPGLIVTIIFACPAPIRLTYLGIKQVPTPMIEAGKAFGATRGQLLRKVELPSALPTIMAGLTQCIMLSLSMVVIAALIGANGLGRPVVRALNTVNIPLGLEAGLAIVILAVILDRMSRIGGSSRSGSA